MANSMPCKCHHLQEAHDPVAGCGYCHCTSFQDATSEYTEELLYLSDMALASVKEDLESQSIKPLFVLRYPDDHLDVIRLHGRYVGLYQHREARHRIFQAIRIMVELFGITAVVTVGDAWVGRSTEKARKLTRQEFERISSIGTGFEVAIEQGLVERAEAVVITVQTPKRMMTMMQMYQRGQGRGGCPVILQEVHISEMDMTLYHGALKMFGNQEEQQHVEPSNALASD